MGKVNPELTRQQRAGNRLGPSESHQTMWAHFSEQTLLWCKGSEGAFCGPNFYVNLKKEISKPNFMPSLIWRSHSWAAAPLCTAGCLTPLHFIENRESNFYMGK